MSSYIKLVQGDANNPQVQATITDDNTGVVVDLTYGTCVLKFRQVAATTLTDTISGTITNAVGGVVVFPMSPASMAGPPGDYEGQISVTWAAPSPKVGTQSVYNTLRFRLAPSF